MKKILALTLALILAFALFTACTEKEPEPTAPPHVDYVAQTKLDMDGPTFKQEVTWGKHSHIDGDTSHFEVPRSFDSSGTVKARYLAVDTPESTGHIEEWGKAASEYTKSKLSAAKSIIIESDDDSWNFDGNGRYLVWVWYQPNEGDEYRCLNIELLQNGLGASSSASEGRYGTNAVAAIAQASREKLVMFSNDKDPEFPYGEAVSLTLKELRTNAEQYNGQKVSVIYEVVNTGTVDVTDVSIKEASAISKENGKIDMIKAGEKGTYTFTVTMGKKDLVSGAEITYKAENLTFVDVKANVVNGFQFPLAQFEILLEIFDT